jgi:hypothetical protein
MDSDKVESKNLGHQDFLQEDIGNHKVTSLIKKLTSPSNNYVKLIGIVDDLKNEHQLKNYDIVVICVDRPDPRRMVHNTTTKWLDVRCMGDAFIALDFTMCMEEIINLTPNHKPQSCQYSNALQTQNIQFGYMLAATFACQWLFQIIRQHHNLNSTIPNSKIISLTFGELNKRDE